MNTNEKPLNESFGTLSQTINGLINLGYTHDFNIAEECLLCHQLNATLSPEDFQIDKVYRFEGASNPDDQSILYAISSIKHDIKGTIVNGYGISADDKTSKMIEKLQTNQAHKPNNTSSTQVDSFSTLNPQLIEMNLNDFIVQIKNDSTWADNSIKTITIFKSETMRIVLMGLRDNAELKAHKANGVISVQVLDGKINFVTDLQTSKMEKGQMITLLPNVVHSVVALTESFFLLTLALNKA